MRALMMIGMLLSAAVSSGFTMLMMGIASPARAEAQGQSLVARSLTIVDSSNRPRVFIGSETFAFSPGSDLTLVAFQNADGSIPAMLGHIGVSGGGAGQALLWLQGQTASTVSISGGTSTAGSSWSIQSDGSTDLRFYNNTGRAVLGSRADGALGLQINSRGAAFTAPSGFTGFDAGGSSTAGDQKNALQEVTQFVRSQQQQLQQKGRP